MQKKLIICQFSDSHLGNRQYGSDLRYLDFFNAFDKVLQKILEIKPDIVFFCGDLFNQAYPTPDMIKRVVEKFGVYFQKGGAPIIAIAGNHEYSQTIERHEFTQIMNLLEDIFVVIGKKFFTFDAEFDVLYGRRNSQGEFGILRKPEEGYDIAFAGLNRGYDLLNRVVGIKERHPELFTKDIPRCLLIHAVTKDVESELHAAPETDISFQDLEKFRFSYIAMGHQHQHKQYDNQHIYLAGSTEDYDDEEWDWDKGLYKVVMTWEEGDLSSVQTQGKFIPIPKVRGRKKITWDLGLVASNEVKSILQRKVEELKGEEGGFDPGKMYHIIIKGNLQDGRIGLLNLQSLWDAFKENQDNGLFGHRITLTPGEEVEFQEKKDDNTILEEIFSQLDYKRYLGKSVEENVILFEKLKKEVLQSIADQRSLKDKLLHAKEAFEAFVQPYIKQRLREAGELQ